MDIATLGYEIDPAGLTAGVGGLQKLTKEAGKAESAAGKLEKKVDQLALSQKQLAFANRQLPMQFTDIAVSLQAGMNPMQVLLQQGTQIRDMYGGVGAALKSSARYMLGLVNPATLSAAAIFALVAAFKAAEDQQFAFAKALLTTGGYVGMSVSELERLVDTMAELEDVSHGVARRALLEVAQSGQFTGEEFRMVAETAAKMQVATGQAISDTIDKFKEIEKDPVAALLKLNRTEHFLTRSQLDRVAALVEEQREQEAAAYGARIYAERLDDVAAAAEVARPHLSQMWKEAKEGGSSALEELKDFTEFLAAAGAQMKDVPWWKKLGPTGGALAAIRAMQNAQPAPGLNIPMARDAVDSAKEEARLEREAKIAQWHADSVKYASDRERLEQSILRMRTEAMELGISRSAIEAREAAMRAAAAKQERKAASDPSDGIIQRLQKQIALNQEATKSGDELTATERQLVAIEIELAGLGAKITPQRRAEIDALMAKARATDEAAQATARAAKEEEALSRLREQTSLAEQNRQRGNRIDLIGMSRGAAAAEMLRRQLDLHRWYEDQVAELRRQAAREKRSVTKAEEQELEASLQRQLAAERKYQEERRRLMSDWTVGVGRAFEDYVDMVANVAGTTNNLFTNAFQGAEDAFVKFARTGKIEFSDLVDQMIADLARLSYRQMFMGLLGSITGGGGTTGTLLDLMSSKDFGFASGGYTGRGGVYEPAGIVHKGEVVWSQSDVARAGGVRAVETMRRGGQGYSIAGPITIQIENNGSPATARATQRQMPDGETLIRIVLDAVADDAASGGKVALAMKSRFELRERV